MSNPDSSQRFLFDNFSIRGEIVGLDQSYKAVLERHNYPDKIKDLIGEFMAASALLSSSIKFDGSLIIQLNAKGQLRTLMAECSHQTGLRAIARYNDDYTDAEPLFSEPKLAISILPAKGSRYQGIVEFNLETGIAGAIESYFEQSEQIKTRIWLKSGNGKAAGYMIQAMPESAEHSQLSKDSDSEDWTRIEHLSSTIKDEELLELDNETLLFRLFHEEELRLFDDKELHFACSCSEERSRTAILQMGIVDVREILEELNSLDVNCQFCNSHYHFEADEIEQMFADHFKNIN